MRTIVAAFGNELRGDDGFGIAVLRRLEAQPSNHGGEASNVQYLEVGTGGLRLTQELMTPCDRLIIVDAAKRGGPPGSVYLLEVEALTEPRPLDMHLALPGQALALAKALGIAPAEIFLVGCEPGEVDELRMDLTPPVRAAVDVAVDHVRRLLERD